MNPKYNIHIIVLVILAVLVLFIVLIPQNRPWFSNINSGYIMTPPPTSTPPPPISYAQLGSSLPSLFPKELVLEGSTVVDVKKISLGVQGSEYNVLFQIVYDSQSARQLYLSQLKQNGWNTMNSSLSRNHYIIFAIRGDETVQISFPADGNNVLDVRVSYKP